MAKSREMVLTSACQQSGSGSCKQQGSDDGLVVVSDGVQKLWGCGAEGGESGFARGVIRSGRS